jgi:hypothetical protein
MFATTSSSESNLVLARKAISVFVDQNQLDAQMELEDRENTLKESLRQLEEAKQIMPVLFAKPGDQFVYRGTRIDASNTSDYGSKFLEYVGRNETPPVQLDHFTQMYNKQYATPNIGWLVFRWVGGERIDAGLRGACCAWPKECYQYYDGAGHVVKDTLCVPPNLCHMLLRHPE